MTDQKKQSKFEEFQVSGEKLLAKVREILAEGNVRRVILKRDDGTVLIEVPLTTGLAVTVLTGAFAPVLVAIGAIAALLTSVTIVVERRDDDDEEDEDTTAAAPAELTSGGDTTSND